ncbi:hypothetical protein CEXT_301351 [Caerostris extrusa]|uniref:Uncharacterized protein n=1 Tax=Caerostris extrusa TaxID=172846 RepID=A0AAV4XQP5_CAEEX|nr:hypothetical protein CEXT_301351 [Caerostris extrusa]
MEFRTNLIWNLIFLKEQVFMINQEQIFVNCVSRRSFIPEYYRKGIEYSNPINYTALGLEFLYRHPGYQDDYQVYL